MKWLMDNYITVTKAASIIGITRQAVLKAIYLGRIKANRFGCIWAINRSAAKRYKDNRNKGK